MGSMTDNLGQSDTNRLEFKEEFLGSPNIWLQVKGDGSVQLQTECKISYYQLTQQYLPVIMHYYCYCQQVVHELRRDEKCCRYNPKEANTQSFFCSPKFCMIMSMTCHLFSTYRELLCILNYYTRLWLWWSKTEYILLSNFFLGGQWHL